MVSMTTGATAVYHVPGSKEKPRRHRAAITSKPNMYPTVEK